VIVRSAGIPELLEAGCGRRLPRRWSNINLPVKSSSRSWRRNPEDHKVTAPEL